MNLALLAVPNVIEKPVKVLKNAVKSRKLAKAVDKLVTNTQLTAKSQPSPSITFKTPPKKEPPTIKITGKDIELNNLIDRFNKFADYYGYTKVPSGADLSEAEKIMKNVFDQHNTFYRGLALPSMDCDVAEVVAAIGANKSSADQLNYLAKAGRKGDTYVSPGSNAAMYGDGQNVAILRRKYNLGENPKTWLADADFDFTDTPATHLIGLGVNYP